MKTRREVEAETMSPCGQPVAPAKSLTLMPTAARFGTVGGEITGAGKFLAVEFQASA